MVMETIPVVDLRLLSQADLNALSATSSSAAGDHRRRRHADDDDLVIPKIDRSVFNESAGSRKQTYSRFRLAPSNPSSSSSATTTARRRGRPSAAAAAAAAILPAGDDAGRRENKQIVDFLRRLFAKNGVDVKVADEKPVPIDAEISVVAPVAAEGADNREMDVLNVTGAPVDLVRLGEKEDLFGDELRRQTQGFVREEEFLAYLARLEGQWGSRRKRRKIVDAAKFGDGLPKGWKLLLGLKRKEGNVWLHCRRYISPNGKQFTSCKEVSSYLLSFLGPQDPRQSSLGQKDEGTLRVNKTATELAAGIIHQEDIARGSHNHYSQTRFFSVPADSEKRTDLFRVENPANAQHQNLIYCQKCNLTFSDKEERVRHLLKFHRRGAKRRRLGKSVGDGVIIKDGKFECQFCHKTFTERHRYNGHVGIHVKYSDRSLEVLSEDIAMENGIGFPSARTPLAFSGSGDSVHHEKEQNLLQELRAPIKSSSPQSMEIGKIDCSLKAHDYEKESNFVQEICTVNTTGETNTGVPQGNQLIENNKFDCNAESLDHEKENNPAQEICTNIPIGGVKVCSRQKDEHIEDSKIDCKPKFCPSEVIRETSKRKSAHGQFDGYGKLDLDQRNIADTSNCMNIEPNVCLDATAPCPVNVGNSASKTSAEKVFYASVLTDEIEKSSIDQRIVSENNISDGGPVPTGMVQSGSSDKDVVPENDMHEEIDVSVNERERTLEKSMVTPFGGGQACAIETSVGDMPPSNMKEAMLEEMDSDGLEVDLETNHALSDNDVKRDTIDGENMAQNLAIDIQSSWVQLFGSIPDLGMSSNQDEGELGNVNQERGKISDFEELRLDDIHPDKHIIEADQDSGRELEASMELAYHAALENSLAPDVQLEWDMTLPETVSRQQLMTTVCIWCGREFEHEVAGLETQPESVGFICPACKAKISGQIGVFDDDMPNK